jgi:SAM-dependent methyltransferase
MDRLSGIIACPDCHGPLKLSETGAVCERLGYRFEMVNGVLDLRPKTAPQRPEEAAWGEHWSEDKQQSLSQRFFSVYRKAVFARAVAYFVGRYLAAEGVLLEAGSGTSETSMRIGKNGGLRTLVAVDLVPGVLERCHAAMDLRICADIFALPFQDGGIHGIWNVGVMEHFTHAQIDAILKEFHRVLKPSGRVVLLWPAVFSIPQRILRAAEWIINLRRRGARFCFHPDEISQLRGAAQGREVLGRNGFETIKIDLGLRTLMAFETLVGEKDRAT